jgi:hypothetical protein
VGNWSMHIEGTGSHDNGLETDAESMMRDFAGKLACAGHIVQAASITTGGTRILPPTRDTGRIESPPDDYRTRS